MTAFPIPRSALLPVLAALLVSSLACNALLPPAPPRASGQRAATAVFATPTPVPVAATATPLPPTAPAGPRPGHWQGQQPYVAFDVTADGQIENFTLTAPFVSATCTLTLARIVVADDAFAVDAATADPQTAMLGKFVIAGQFAASGETASGTHLIELCGRTLSLFPEEQPWQAGWQGLLSAPSELVPTLAAPPAVVTATPAAPVAAPGTYLSDFEPKAILLGYGVYSVGRFAFSSEDAVDNIHEGDPMVMHGVEYPHGIFAHAPARFKYDLGQQVFTELSATLGLIEHIDCGDGVVFKVEQDGQTLYTSPAMYAWTPPVKMRVTLTGSPTLLLWVEPGNAGNPDCDWAIWGDPVLR